MVKRKSVSLLFCHSSHVKRTTSCRELFRTLNILPVPCAYIMETVYYVKLNNKGLKQNLAIHDYKTWHRLDFQAKFCRTDIFKKSVNNLGTKLYNKLPNYLKNLENLEPFKKQLKSFFITTELLFSGWILVLCVGTLKRNFMEKYGIGNQTTNITSCVRKS
jgi:hypothetical protein